MRETINITIYLKDSAIRISNCIIILDLHTFQVLDKGTLKVSTLSCLHGSVNETLKTNQLEQ